LLACFCLITVLKQADNARLLKHEFRLAAQKPAEFWDFVEPDGILGFAFPVLTTCVISGVDFWSETSNSTRVVPLPFGTKFDEVDNDDGLTILDITDPTHIKYCFSAFKGLQARD